MLQDPDDNVSVEWDEDDDPDEKEDENENDNDDDDEDEDILGRLQSTTGDPHMDGAPLLPDWLEEVLQDTDDNIAMKLDEADEEDEGEGDAHDEVGVVHDDGDNGDDAHDKKVEDDGEAARLTKKAMLPVAEH